MNTFPLLDSLFDSFVAFIDFNLQHLLFSVHFPYVEIELLFK